MNKEFCRSLLNFLADSKRIFLTIVFIAFLPGSILADELCGLDIDGDGNITSTTDGLLAVRWLLGLRGDSLIDSVIIGQRAMRSTGSDIDAYLSLPDCQIMLDVDGNQQLDPLTDGLLIVRALSGYTDNALVVFALGIHASRATGEAVQDHLAFYRNTRAIVIEAEDLLPGDSVGNANQELVLENVGTTPASVRVIEGVDADGYPIYTISTTGGSIDLHLPDPNQLSPYAFVPQDQETLSMDTNTDAGSGWVVWDSSRSWFLKHGELEGRVPNDARVNNISVCEYYSCREGEIIDPDLFIRGWSVQTRESFQLLSQCSQTDIGCYESPESEPVLFVHGLLIGDSLGNGRGTWGDWPTSLLGDNQVAFEFRWRTNARFQDVARDLYVAIERIYDETGKKVHLVAHSFGGVLVRTLLQRIGEADNEGPVKEFSNIGSYVASVVTLGAPLSAIVDKEKTMHGVQFPRGQDTQGVFNDDIFSFEGCDQLGCQQMGVDVVDEGEAKLYNVTDAPGWLAARLATTTDRLPDVHILTLIGLTVPRDSDTIIDEGDGLFSGWGQRFHPSLGVVQGGGANYWTPLLNKGNYGAAKVTEKVVGMDSSAVPGGSAQVSVLEPGFEGYRHSIAVNGNGSSEFLVENVLEEPTQAELESDTPVEPYVLDCVSSVIGLCGNDHYAVSEVNAWIAANTDADTLNTPLNDTGISSCSDGKANGLRCPLIDYPGQDAQYGRDMAHNDDTDGHAGFSFTKIDTDGSALPASATDWSCIQDNVTGLLWEVKTRDGGLHDEQYRYNWYNTDRSSNGGHEGYANNDGANCYGYDVNNPSTYCNTQAYVDRVNAAGWCGHRDWRMPSKVELRGIVSMDRINPAIDEKWFPHTRNSYYWSASPYADGTDSAWTVYFSVGHSFAEHKGGDRYARLVRSGQ